MSDCSTHAFEYPGVTRIKVFFTDKTEREIDYPFVTLDREIECVTVDGIEYMEVVRCMDCKYLKPRDEECGGRNWCKRMSFEVVLDGYCAWGVRKDD